MGKCKKRQFCRNGNETSWLKLSREGALALVTEKLEFNPGSFEAKNLISLFGLTPEELSESGVTYEILRALDSVF